MQHADPRTQAHLDTPNNVVGNFEAKYDSKNPIARWLVDGFLHAVSGAIARTGKSTVYEVGAGECELALRLLQRLSSQIEHYTATDLDISRAEALVADMSDAPKALELKAASIYGLELADQSQDMMVCCEVLEHLERPTDALAELARVCSNYIVISTPREPLWRAMNFARGKYMGDLGNTPGHIQHFSRRGLIGLVEQFFDIEWVQTPIPWTILLARARKRS